jgi:hypothetical protein
MHRLFPGTTMGRRVCGTLSCCIDLLMHMLLAMRHLKKNLLYMMPSLAWGTSLESCCQFTRARSGKLQYRHRSFTDNVGSSNVVKQISAVWPTQRHSTIQPNYLTDREKCWIDHLECLDWPVPDDEGWAPRSPSWARRR